MMYCKFWETDRTGTVYGSGGIRHEYCNNPKMLTINKKDNGRIPCMGERCGVADFEDAEDQNE
jgi:hypothetical protein